VLNLSSSLTGKKIYSVLSFTYFINFYIIRASAPCGCKNVSNILVHRRKKGLRYVAGYWKYLSLFEHPTFQNETGKHDAFMDNSVVDSTKSDEHFQSTFFGENIDL
jgi:hypothetical protein